MNHSAIINNHSFSVSKTRLFGEVEVSGAKNSALRLLAATILTEEKVVINQFPSSLLDIGLHIEMLEEIGKNCFVSGQSIEISEGSKGLISELFWQKRSIRNTLLILGALLARFGKGKVPLPGGCKLGERKYDLHVMLMERLGATVWEEEGFLCAEVNGNLIGNDIFLPIRSTGATENSIICGCLATGVTTVWNPHVRPEIIDLIEFLRSMGCRIEVFGQQCIRIYGSGGKLLKGTVHSVIPDNMEAITWAIAAAITNGEVVINKFPFEHLEVPLIFLRESGMKFSRSGDSLVVKSCTPFPLEISTGPYPGINSDMQPLFAVYGAVSRGESRIIDLRFPGRYGYAEELAKMGLDYRVENGLLIVNGGKVLHGALVNAIDLRAGMALLLAGMISEGETIIENAWQIRRGYEHLDDKLIRLMA